MQWQKIWLYFIILFERKYVMFLVEENCWYLSLKQSNIICILCLKSTILLVKTSNSKSSKVWVQMRHCDLKKGLLYKHVWCELVYTCKITLTAHPFSAWEWEQRTCRQAATSTSALLHPCLCGCMKYSVWEKVRRWGSEYISEPVRYCLKLLMVKSGKVSLPLSLHFLYQPITLISAQHFELALNPSICVQDRSALSLCVIYVFNLSSGSLCLTAAHPPSQPFSFPHSPPLCLTTFIVHLLSHLH